MTLTDYNRAHREVERTRGKASSYLCIDCKDTPASHWSLNESLVKSGPVLSATGTGKAKYAPNDPQAYEPRCFSCHGKMDRASDPEWMEATRRNALKGSETASALRSSDPAFAERSLNQMREAQAEHVRRVNTEPEYAAAALKGLTAGRAMRRKCLDCGMVSNPGSLGRHLSLSGHRGYTDA